MGKIATTFKSQKQIHANIIYVYLDIRSEAEPTAIINPRKHGFVSKMQTSIPANINEFTVNEFNYFFKKSNIKISFLGNCTIQLYDMDNSLVHMHSLAVHLVYCLH